MAEEKAWFTAELHDTSWIVVQKNTFTNWCNDRLKDTGVKIADLEVDLQDGLTLIQLLEVLAQRKKLPGRYKSWYISNLAVYEVTHPFQIRGVF